MPMQYGVEGQGPQLLLIHGLGGDAQSWRPLIPLLARKRQLIAIDLPGFGNSPPLDGEVSIDTLAVAVTEFLREHDLIGVDAVGSNMGARLVLELARRGVVGRVISLDPDGFWQGWERAFFNASIRLSVRLMRMLQRVMPVFTHTSIGRAMLFPQFSPQPWKLPAEVLLHEMRAYAASQSFDTLLDSLVHGPTQQGAPRGSLKHAVTIGWGRQDRVCLPRQAARALALFPDARLHWFEHCGHFPHWDAPEETARMILNATR